LTRIQVKIKRGNDKTISFITTDPSIVRFWVEETVSQFDEYDIYVKRLMK